MIAVLKFDQVSLNSSKSGALARSIEASANDQGAFVEFYWEDDLLVDRINETLIRYVTIELYSKRKPDSPIHRISFEPAVVFDIEAPQILDGLSREKINLQKLQSEEIQNLKRDQKVDLGPLPPTILKINSGVAQAIITHRPHEGAPKISETRYIAPINSRGDIPPLLAADAILVNAGQDATSCEASLHGLADNVEVFVFRIPDLKLKP